MNDTERLLLLNMAPDVGSRRTQNLLKHFGSLERVFSAEASDLIKVKDIGTVIAASIRQSIKEIDLTKELELIKKHDVEILTFLDKAYPKNLKNIYDPPVVLYVKGRLLPQDELALSIVGSRLASFYGLQTAERLAFELASRGITIVSGLARGIDSSAHKGALKAKKRTIAVLGSGLAHIYPEEHKKLAERIMESGAVISEFPMNTIPDKGNFPKRNRIISGLSLGVVCVEAAEQSGALITCDYALEQGRDVFAVPGKIDSVTSKGTHNLIKQGARLVETADDILEELNLDISDLAHLRGGQGLDMDKDEKLVYNLLSSDPRHVDELCEESGMGLSMLAKILFNLQVKKFAKELAGKNFVRA